MQLRHTKIEEMGSFVLDQGAPILILHICYYFEATPFKLLTLSFVNECVS